MGYENPSNVTSFEQTQTKSEWTIFIRLQNPMFRPLISQFISYADFQNPRDQRLITVQAPEDHEGNKQEAHGLFQIMTKLNRNMFKLDKDDKIILVDISINLNNKLSSTRAPQRPCFIQLPLNFKTKEQLETFTVFFDVDKVKEVIKVEDHLQKHLSACDPSKIPDANRPLIAGEAMPPGDSSDEEGEEAKAAEEEKEDGADVPSIEIQDQQNAD